jgi:hypothetical protein
MYVPVLIPSLDISNNSFAYLESIYIFNTTLICAVLAFALYKIKKLLNEVPQIA